MAQNKRQILMVVTLIVVISVNNIAQALNINPNACAILVNSLKNDVGEQFAISDKEDAMQLMTTNLLKGEFFGLSNQCIEDLPNLDPECISQIAKDFLNLVTNHKDVKISPQEVFTIIRQDNDLSNVCPSSA
ncbi:unnamed protein product [Amaranthus hypochondriacus]